MTNRFFRRNNFTGTLRLFFTTPEPSHPLNVLRIGWKPPSKLAGGSAPAFAATALFGACLRRTAFLSASAATSARTRSARSSAFPASPASPASPAPTASPASPASTAIALTASASAILLLLLAEQAL